MNPLSNETIAILEPLITEFEGVKLKAYKCPAGVVTIGAGFTGKIPDECRDIGTEVKMGMTITQEQSTRLLKVAMDKYWQGALKYSPNLINASPSRQAAIIDFCYNCGLGNYQVSSLLLAVNKGDWYEASKSILKWNKARVKGVLKVLPGLVRRREAESKLLLGG